LDFKPMLETYTGVVREVVLGKGEKVLRAGGQASLPLHDFEAAKPARPLLALEMLDAPPTDWPAHLVEPWSAVLADPAAWARKCLEYGADLVSLQLRSTDPAGANTAPEDAAARVKAVSAALGSPLMVYGSGDDVKDALVLPAVAAACSGDNLLLGPAVKENYEVVGKAALDHGHTLIAQSPLDMNLMKELNLKLTKFFPVERIVIDPLSSPTGYGLEYSFSLMERARQAAVMYKDPMLQMPIIANLAEESWKTKEARAGAKQGVLWETVTAVTLILAGADIVVMRHPEALSMVRKVLKGEI
jgi:acetyl-CoA decarbonylase/synthase complex subunit delta